jgi:hypothetical protein
MKRSPLLTSALVAIVIILGGVGVYAYQQHKTATPKVGTGITGRASVSPSCPAERIDSPCPKSAYTGTIYAKTTDKNTVVAQANPDANGDFTISVAAGTYWVTALGSDVSTGAITGGQTVTVTDGSLTSITLSVDTGIR